MSMPKRVAVCAAAIAALAAGTINVQTKTTDQSTASDAYVDVDELGFEMAPNTVYQAQWVLVISSASGLTGAQVAVNGSAEPASVTVTITGYSAAGAPATTNTNAYDQGLDMTGSAGPTRTHTTIRATIINGADAGTAIARIRTSVDGGTVTVHRGSSLVYNTP